jgi:hypothetical protein
MRGDARLGEARIFFIDLQGAARQGQCWARRGVAWSGVAPAGRRRAGHGAARTGWALRCVARLGEARARRGGGGFGRPLSFGLESTVHVEEPVDKLAQPFGPDGQAGPLLPPRAFSAIRHQSAIRLTTLLVNGFPLDET